MNGAAFFESDSIARDSTYAAVKVFDACLVGASITQQSSRTLAMGDESRIGWSLKRCDQ